MTFWENRNYRNLFIFFLCVIATIVFFKYVFFLCWPFVVALIVVGNTYDRLWVLQQKTRINRNFFMVGIVFTGIIFFVTLVGMFIYIISRVCVDSVGIFPILEDKCMCEVDELCRCFSKISGVGFNDVIGMFHQGLEQLGGRFKEAFLPQILKKGAMSFKMIFAFLAKVLITGILIILLMKEYGEWRNFIYQREIFLPVCRILKRLKSLMKEYVKAEASIFFMVTIIVSTGMYIIGIKSGMLWGAFTGILDTLPFIGTGLVLTPLGIWFLIEKNYFAVGICVLTYVVCLITRQIMEPKLIGQGMQISAAGVLISIFAGLKLYGVIGVLFGPLTLIILIECYKEIF